MPDPFARKKNPQLKAERGYTDPKSFVRNDGSEWLVRQDWENRVEELADRCNGKCERVKVLNRLHHPACSGWGCDPHHIRRRSQGRDDRLENLAWLSRWCHIAEDPRKPRWSKKEKADAKPATS
jgi:hypothetical protein